MGQTVSGTLIMDGNAINVDIGFIPDYVKLIYNLEEGDNEVIHEWWRALADLETEGLYGVSISAAGAVTVPTTAATGIIPYDEGDDMAVLVESPVPGAADVKVPCLDYAYHIGATTTPTARTATAVGTITRPTTANGYVYECTTSTGAMAVEPTWPTDVGDTVTDSGSNVWTCIEENLTKGGGMGFTIGATMSTDSDQCVFTAEKHLRTGDMGDAASADPITWTG